MLALLVLYFRLYILVGAVQIDLGGFVGERAAEVGWIKEKVGGVVRVCPDIGRGGPQTPVVRICRAAEVTPTGVCICAAVHPGDRRCLLSNAIFAC